MGKSSHLRTTEDAAAADKPSLFKHHDHYPRGVLDDQREGNDDEPHLLEEASSSTNLLDIYSERSGSDELEEEQQQSIFRTQSSLEVDGELEDLWTLKRANPVLGEGDSDDEDDDEYKSPSKRLCATAAVDWDDAVALDAPFRLTVSESGSFLLS